MASAFVQPASLTSRTQVQGTAICPATTVTAPLMKRKPIRQGVKQFHKYTPLCSISLQSTFGFATYHATARGDSSVWIENNAVGTNFRIVPGLAKKGVSFESVDKPTYYLRHAGFNLWLHKYEPTELYLLDASFVQVPGLADPYAISFESVNYPNYFIRHQGYRLKISPRSPEELFSRDASWTIQILS